MSILAYAPDDLTVIVTADTTLAALQSHLVEHNQWLPSDPFDPARLTIRQIVDDDLSGPRRYGYGTIREHILSMRVELADGRLIKSGANVVKNAAGYDLCRLFTGARGQLATIREVCFKVQPRPESEQFLQASFPTIEEAWNLIEQVDTSPLTPIILDLHNHIGTGPWTVILGFAGPREDVAWQRSEIEKLAAISDTDLSHDAAFWSADPTPPGAMPTRAPSAPSNESEDGGSGGHASREGDVSACPPEPPPTPEFERSPGARVGMAPELAPGAPDTTRVRKISVLPSRLLDTIRQLDLQNLPLLARAGNGILYYRNAPEPPNPQSPIRNPQSLLLRLKHEFDPHHKLPRA